ncbi:hypothetical protein INR49_008338 [Caranx melampygus]|nr:hypothetical protein INR49_008338 [Caranx melampygus]
MDADLSIVLLGNSGAGKSSSGNTILGRAAFESKLVFRPVTTEICEATGRVFERQINVTDTPGILASEEEIKTLCQSLLRSCRPVLFLVVLRIGRFTTEEQEAVEAAIRFEKAYHVFNNGDKDQEQVRKLLLKSGLLHAGPGPV